MGQQQVSDRIKPRAAKEVWNANAVDAEERLTTLEGAVTSGGVPLATETQAGVAKLATQSLVDGGTDPSTIVTPATLADRLNDFQAISAKNQDNGYMGLNGSGFAPPDRIASGARDGTKFARDDGTWASVVAGGVADASTSQKGIVLLDKAPVVATSPIVVGQNSYLLETFIEGLLLQWGAGAGFSSNASILGVSSGAAWIPGLNKVLNVPSMVFGPNQTLVANTMYYVYLYSNAGTPAIELVTTAPSAVYKGSARTKAGDTTRRYIGAVKTSAAGGMFCFMHSRNGDVFYKEHQVNGTAPFSLAQGTSPAATGTTVALGVNATAANRLVPISSRLAWISFYVSAGTTYLSTSDDALGDTSGTGRAVQGTAHALHAVPLNANQDFIWSGGTVFSYLSGYRDER